MTKEEKLLLLLKDLCARLLYGVVYHRNDGANIKLNAIDVERGLLNYTDDIDERECKPYLRPMDSMTEEEKVEIRDLYHQNTQEVFKDPPEIRVYRFYDISVVDWLNKNKFDYRGLIGKGLALEAKEGMYTIK
jgi:hypothetical protein